MPEKTLIHIEESLSEILKELKVMRSWISTERRKRRVSIGILSFIMLMGAFGLSWVFILAQRVEVNQQEAERDREQARAELCESRSQSRESIYAAIDLMALAIAGEMIEDPAVAQQYENFSANLRQELPPLEC